MTCDAEVLIAGAGPVGAVAAYILARAGIHTMLFEAHPGVPEDLRASTLHPPTLEMLDELGVAQDLMAQGLKAPVFQYRDRASGHILPFDLTELKAVTRFPFRLQCEQWKLARAMVARLEALATATCHFSRRITAFEQDEGGVTLHVESPFEIETYRGLYLIGCDGANSIVRKWLKIGFDGFTYPEKFLTVSTDWPIEESFDNLAYVNYIADPDEWLVLLRVPGLWRVLVPAADSETDSALLSEAKKNSVFASLVGENARVQTAHRTIYRVHQRVAQTYRDRRVLLAGDAAHLNNPLGGLGMNSGIHDVWNLCAKLIAILREGAAHHLLDQYTRQRRGVMQAFVQAQTIRNKQNIEGKDPEAQKRRRQEMEAILADDTRRRDYLMTQSMLKSRELEASIS